MKTGRLALHVLICVPIAEAFGACTAPGHPSSSAGAPGAVDRTDPVAADEVLARARARLDGARAAEDRGDHAAARAKAGEAIDGLLSLGEPTDDPERIAALSDAGSLAHGLGDLAAAEKARRFVLEVRARALPDDHPDLQAAREDLAATTKLLGDLHGARELEERVLEVRERTLPADHLDLQKARKNLAVTIKDLGDVQGARALEEQVLEVITRTLHADDPFLQSTRGNLASSLYLLGDIRGARALLERVLEVRERTLPDDDPTLQAVRGNLAVMTKELGDLQAARALEEKVLEVFSRTLPEDHPSLQKARQGLALTVRALGDLEGARALEEKVLEVRLRTLPEDHPELQAARANLALTLAALGDLESARDLEERALEVYSRTLPDDHPSLVRTRGQLAWTLYALGDLQGARVLQEQVLETRLRTLPEDHPDLQTARHNLAATIAALGDLAGARALEEQALEVYSRTLPEDHPDVQVLRGNLAGTLYALGDLEAARALFETVLEVRSRTLPDDHPDMQAARGNLATTIKKLGDLDGARALEQQVLDAFSLTLDDDHPDLQRARQGLATTLHALGDDERARELLEGVLEVRSRTLPRDHPETLEARLNLAVAIAPEGGERCASLVRDLAASCTRLARALTQSSSSREAEERCSSLGIHLSASLSFALGYGLFDPDPALAREAFVLSETTRASALAAARLASLARADGSFGELRKEIRVAGEELARLAQSGGTPAAYDAMVARRDRAQRDLVRLATGSESAAGFSVEPDPAAIAVGLAATDAVVAYRRYERSEIPPGGIRELTSASLCAFVLRGDAELRLVDLGPIEPIEAAVAEWRDTLGVGEGRGVGAGAKSPAATAERAIGERIRALVLDPLLPSLAGARRLVLVLDDVLQAVPIDALPAGEDRLGDRYEIELRSTAQELLAGSEPFAGEPLVLLLGGADYSAQEQEVPVVASLLRGGAWGEGFSPLPGTNAEARGLEELSREVGEAREVIRLEGESASRPSIETLAPSARFLHLATHGWFAPESVRSWNDSPGTRQSAGERVRASSPMLLCGLALAGANLPADAVGRFPGLVTAEEISGWDLANCELAVLSACDTNVGDRRAGQGVASLQKALHMAGARSVITSLWKVPDEATGELMLDFYRRIWIEKEPKAQALWNAKKRLREARDARGQLLYSTRDWAAWVLTGDPK
ncbi:MAG: tetratricopeptide repeat protein [Planctomycetota bacterium]